MAMPVRGKNEYYGDYKLLAFASAFDGWIHLCVSNEAGEDLPASTSSVDITPSHARKLAKTLRAAAKKAEKFSGDSDD